jgi:hypothetical protein
VFHILTFNSHPSSNVEQLPQDENKDGLFTVEEFKNWIETNRIVQLVKDGEDGDLDRLLTKHSKSQKEEKESS